MDAWSGSRRRLALAACTAALLCAGCDKPPPTVEVYVPPALGTTWTLKRESTGSFGSGTSFVTIERTERTWNGQPVIAFDSVALTTLATAKGETIAFTAGDTPFISFDPPIGLPWPLHVGRTHKSAHRMTTHWNGQTTPFEVEHQVEAYDEVTVPAGTFKALRIRSTDSRGQQETRWFSPERGIAVKQALNRSEGWPQGPGTQEVELVPPRTERMARVGFLWNGGVGGDSPGPDFEQTLAKGLRERGWVNGQNVLFVHRYNKESTEEQGVRNVEDLIRLKADVIVDAFGALPARLTKTIPIVTLYCPDPVRIGVADSYVRPGRNVTGMASFLNLEESSTFLLSLELLKEAVPSVTRVAVLVTPGYGVDMSGFVAFLGRAFERRKVVMHGFTIRTVEDIEPAFAEMRRAGVQAVWVDTIGILGSELPRVAALAYANRLPLSSSNPRVAVAGGLIGAGFDGGENRYRAAAYIDKILKGAKPGELPFEQPGRIRVAVNLKTARAIGVTLPKSVIARVDQVIE